MIQLRPLERLERLTKKQWVDSFMVFWLQFGYPNDPPAGMADAYWMLLEDKSKPGLSTHTYYMIQEAQEFHARNAAELCKQGRRNEAKIPIAQEFFETVKRLTREYETEWARQNPRGEEMPAIEKVYARAHMNVAIIFLKTELLTGDTKEMKKQEVMAAIDRIWQGPKTKEEKTADIVGLVTRAADALQVRLNGWPNNPAEEPSTRLRHNRDFKPVGGVVGKIMQDMKANGKVEIQ